MGWSREPVRAGTSAGVNWGAANPNNGSGLSFSVANIGQSLSNLSQILSGGVNVFRSIFSALPSAGGALGVVARGAGGVIGGIGQQLGLSTPGGALSGAAVSSIATAIALLVASTLGNLTHAGALGRQMAEAYASGIHSGSTAIISAGQEIAQILARTILAGFGRSGNALASMFSRTTSTLVDTGEALFKIGTDHKKLMAGVVNTVGTIGVTLAGAAAGLGAGPLGALVGGLVGSILGVLASKMLGGWFEMLGKMGEVGGRVLGEAFKFAGEALKSFVEILQDCTDAGMQYAASVRQISLMSGMSDASANSAVATLGMLGVNRPQAEGMFSGMGQMQWVRSIVGSAWGVQGMPMQGEFQTSKWVQSLHDQYQNMLQSFPGFMGPLMGRMMLQGNDAMQLMPMMGVSRGGLEKRLDFASEFGGMSPSAIKQFNEDIGFLQ